MNPIGNSRRIQGGFQQTGTQGNMSFRGSAVINESLLQQPGATGMNFDQML